MDFEIEDLGPTKKRVSITVPAPRVDSNFSIVYNQIAQRVSLPGFRRGRVPMSHLRKRFARQAVADATQALVEEGWTRAMDDLTLVPVSAPDIDAEPAAQGKPYSFSVTVEVLPEVELLPYEGLKVTRPGWTVGDGAIDHELGHLQEQVATWVPVESRPVADGDLAVIDYRGTIDGEAFEGGTAEDAEIVIGGGQFIPGFEAQIVGHAVGDGFDIEITFPEDYGAEHLAGKDAVFACSLKDAKARDIPEIGQDLADRLGLEDMDAVRAEVGRQILERYDRQSGEEARAELKLQVGETYDFDVPDALVDETLQEQQGEILSELVRGGMEYAEASTKLPELLEERRPQLVIALRAELVLDRIAEKEAVEVAVHEVNAFIERMVRSMGEYGARMRQVYKDPGRRTALQRRMRHDKTLDFLLTKAEVTTVEREVPAHLDHHHEDDHGEADE